MLVKNKKALINILNNDIPYFVFIVLVNKDKQMKPKY